MVTFAKNFCLLLWLSARGASHHSVFMGNSSAISHTCQPCLPSRWVLLFVPGVVEQNENSGLFPDFMNGYIKFKDSPNY